MDSMQIFVSSPGDVAQERTLARRVIERLQGEFDLRAQIEAIFWEHEPLSATAGFQEQIVPPSHTDIVVCILWSRLGTRLPPRFVRPDGTRYNSGTEFEFEDAVSGYRRHGKPELLVYRKTAEPLVSLQDKDALLEKLKQKEALDGFVRRWFHDVAEGTLKAAFHPFEQPDHFEELLEQHLRKLILRRLPPEVEAPSPAPARLGWTAGSPFRGLQVFEAAHAPVFFGRTRAVSEVLDALRRQAMAGRTFVLILGMSGCGKSSLARAGVIPMLTQPGVIEGVGLWRQALLRPSSAGANLHLGLAEALLRPEALPEIKENGVDSQALAEVLATTPKAALPLIHSALSATRAKKSGAGEARLVLLVDQLEELFSLPGVEAAQAGGFVETLDVLARGGDLWVLATLRSDFYPRCQQVPALVNLKSGDGQYDLLPPTPAEIGQIIRQPALAAGLRFEEEPERGERLEDLLRDAAVANPGILPLLEFTLEELYQRRREGGVLTLEAYRDLGGVEGALARRAEEIFSGLEPAVQAAFPRVMRALVHVIESGDTGATSRRAPLAAFEDSLESQHLVQAFIDARLLVTDLADDGSAIVGIAHEALLDHWPRLAAWIEENREHLRQRARLSVAARRWEEEERRPDLLLPPGKPLAEGRDLLRQSRAELNAREIRFVDASARKAGRQKLFKRATAATLLLLLLVAAGAFYVLDSEHRRAQTQAQTAKKVSDILINQFQLSDPTKARGESVSAREMLDKGVQRIRRELTDQPEVEATLLDTIGVVYRNLGLYAQALEVFREALSLRERVLGETNLDVAVSLDHLATVYWDQSRYEEAGPLFRRALGIRRERLGETHPDVAKAFNNLGNLMYAKGEMDEAERLIRQAVQIHRAALGKEHILVAMALNNLAIVLSGKADLQGAETALREALALHRKLLGDNHPQVAMALNNLGSLLQNTGQYEEAETLLREALAIYHKVLGGDHPQVAMTLYNLGMVRLGKKDLAAAERLMRQALELGRRLLGPEHRQVAGCLNGLGQVRAAQGRKAEAETHFREALAIHRKVLGNGHPDVAANLCNLAAQLEENGKPEEAGKALAEALEIVKQTLPPDHPQTAWTRSVQGAHLAALGKYETSEKLLLASYRRLRRVFGPRAEATRLTLERLVHLYEGWGKSKKAAAYRKILEEESS